MNKRNLIIIGIVLLALIAGGFWYAQNNKNGNQEGVDSRQEKVVKNQEQVNQETKDSKTKQLSPEKIEKLKEESNLVWYEIPELNIKFLVTKDTKEDLRYSFKKHLSFKNSISIKKILMYSLSETNEELSGCTLSEEYGWSCGWIDISIALKEDINEYISKNLAFVYCDPGVLLSLSNNYVCVTKNTIGGVDPVILDQGYRNFFHIVNSIKSKIFGIYLNTIQSIK